MSDFQLGFIANTISQCQGRINYNVRISSEMSVGELMDILSFNDQKKIDELSKTVSRGQK